MPDQNKDVSSTSPSSQTSTLTPTSASGATDTATSDNSPFRLGNSALSGAAAGAAIGGALFGPIGAALGAATVSIVNTFASPAGQDLIAQWRKSFDAGMESFEADKTHEVSKTSLAEQGAKADQE